MCSAPLGANRLSSRRLGWRWCTGRWAQDGGAQIGMERTVGPRRWRRQARGCPGSGCDPADRAGEAVPPPSRSPWGVVFRHTVKALGWTYGAESHKGWIRVRHDWKGPLVRGGEPRSPETARSMGVAGAEGVGAAGVRAGAAGATGFHETDGGCGQIGAMESGLGVSGGRRLTTGGRLPRSPVQPRPSNRSPMPVRNSAERVVPQRSAASSARSQLQRQLRRAAVRTSLSSAAEVVAT